MLPTYVRKVRKGTQLAQPSCLGLGPGPGQNTQDPVGPVDAELQQMHQPSRTPTDLDSSQSFHRPGPNRCSVLLETKMTKIWWADTTCWVFCFAIHTEVLSLSCLIRSGN
jgi:hypothetical protein